jgi:hypothetical protein
MTSTRFSIQAGARCAMAGVSSLGRADNTPFATSQLSLETNTG